MVVTERLKKKTKQPRVESAGANLIKEQTAHDSDCRGADRFTTILVLRPKTKRNDKYAQFHYNLERFVMEKEAFDDLISLLS